MTNDLPDPDHVPDGAVGDHSAPRDPVTGGDPAAADAAAEAAAADATPAEEVAAETEAAAVDVGEDIDELSAANAQRDDYYDRLLRLQADFENYKKRVAKQQSEFADRAAESLVDKLLPVLDTADLAVSHGGGEDLVQVRSALLAALEREGLERIDGAGEAFDPNVHDAVAHEPGDGAQEVAEVLRAGYRWKGRVIRAAMVKVRG